MERSANQPVNDPRFLEDPPGNSPAFIQIGIILSRRWRLLLMVWLGTVAAVSTYTFATKRTYRPQAQLEIRSEVPQVGISESSDPALMASSLMWENYYRTQEGILKSPSLIKKTLAVLPDSIRLQFDKNGEPIREFSRNLDIEKVRGSFIMRVGYIDKDPQKATQIVNSLVNIYLDESNKRLRDKKSGTVEVLSKETLPLIRKRVEMNELTLEDFKSESGFVDFEVQYNTLISSRQKVSSRITELRLKRLNTDAELQALSSYGSNGVTGAFNPKFHGTRILEPLVQQRALTEERLAEVLQHLKGNHPKVMELRAQVDLLELKIREAIRGTLAALRSDVESMEREEAALTAEREQIEKEMSAAGRKLAEFRRLDAELVSSREVYNAYLRKEGVTSATSGSGLASIEVIDWAIEPTRPYKPNVLFNLLVGAVVGLMLGMLAIVVSEQLDDRIVSLREVEAFVGLDVLSVVPKLTGTSRDEKKPFLLDQDASVSDLEAFRILRGQIVTRLEKLKTSKLVGILSAGPGEGKSTVAANLARVLAMEGRRVLVFDADMRRPSARIAFGIDEGVGLEDLLSGKAQFSEAVCKSAVEGVDVLGAKAGARGAAELAGTEQFEASLAKARENYDFVLIDSAPVNLVSEAALVARHADATVLVIREGKAGRGSTQAAVKRLRGMGVELLGAVLNCSAPNRRGYGYGYSYDGYGYYGQ